MVSFSLGRFTLHCTLLGFWTIGKPSRQTSRISNHSHKWVSYNFDQLLRKLVRGQCLAFPYFILSNWRIGFSNVLPLQRSSCFKTLCEVAFSCSWNNSVVIKCRHVRRDANHRGSSFKLWIQKRPQRLGHLVFPGDPTGLLLRPKIGCYRRYHQKK